MNKEPVFSESGEPFAIERLNAHRSNDLAILPWSLWKWLDQTSCGGHARYEEG